MALLPFDVVEQILVRSDLEDIIRCKSVCKPWYSVISSPPFVKAHLKYSCNKDRNDPELEHRRICSYSIWDVDGWHCDNFFHIVGSCNGLVCISPRDAEFVVTNPCTRELKNIKTPPFRPHLHGDITMRDLVCWGFGYDSAGDDYKVVAGFRKSIHKKRTLFYVFSLKSNTWNSKVIKEVKYMCINGDTGIFYGGSLYWFMMDENDKHTIVKLDLSTEVFYELPQPDTVLYQFNACYRLGVIEDSLCIYESDGLDMESFDSTDSSSLEFFLIWVMRKNNNNSFRWELHANDHWKSKFDVAHFLTLESHGVGPRSYVWGHDDGKRVPSAGHYILASTFVKSLVSPHPYPYVSNNNNHYYKEPKRQAKSHSHSFAPSLLIQFQTGFHCTLERVTKVKEGVEGAGKDNIKKRKRNKKRKRYVFR